MKQLTFSGVAFLSGLHDELLEAGVIDAEAIVEGTDSEVVLTVPKDADEQAIRAVVEAHDHQLAQARAEKVEEIRAAAREHDPVTQAMKAHIEAVKALGNPAAVRAHDVSTGWPG